MVVIYLIVLEVVRTVGFFLSWMDGVMMTRTYVGGSGWAISSMLADFSLSLSPPFMIHCDIETSI